MPKDQRREQLSEVHFDVVEVCLANILAVLQGHPGCPRYPQEELHGDQRTPIEPQRRPREPQVRPRGARVQPKGDSGEQKSLKSGPRCPTDGKVIRTVRPRRAILERKQENQQKSLYYRQLFCNYGYCTAFVRLFHDGSKRFAMLWSAKGAPVPTMVGSASKCGGGVID